MKIPPGPGNFIPRTAEISPAVSIPWPIRSPNRERAAYSLSTCNGLKSPVIPANAYTSDSVIVFVQTAFCPGSNAGLVNVLSTPHQ